jgi:hypothetical protein
MAGGVVNLKKNEIRITVEKILSYLAVFLCIGDSQGLT